jgi:hypothetical protein
MNTGVSTSVIYIGNSLVAYRSYHDLTCAYFNLTSVNLNCPRLVRSDCSMWPIVVYYSSRSTVHIWAWQGHREGLSQLLLKWPRRHGHDPGQATRTFLCMLTRTYTPACFCWHSGRNSGQDGSCYLALDSVTYQASFQATSGIAWNPANESNAW